MKAAWTVSCLRAPQFTHIVARPDVIASHSTPQATPHQVTMYGNIRSRWMETIQIVNGVTFSIVHSLFAIRQSIADFRQRCGVVACHATAMSPAVQRTSYTYKCRIRVTGCQTGVLLAPHSGWSMIHSVLRHLGGRQRFSARSRLPFPFSLSPAPLSQCTGVPSISVPTRRWRKA